MAGGFCGPAVTAHSVEGGVLSNECFLNGLNMFPHATLMLISIPILVAWKKTQAEGKELSTWVHFPGHKIRWILTLILIILNLAEIGEGILSDVQIPGLHFHLYIPHVVALCGSVLSVVYYHYVETWNSPRFLLLLLAYWWGALIIKVLKVVNLFGRGLGVQHVRFDLTWDVIIVYFLLILVELNVIRSLRYVFYRRPVVLQPPDELGRTKFVYSYVNFLSQCTFFWVNKILFHGYKQQMQLQDLGELAEGELAGNNFVHLRRLFEIEKQKKRTTSKDPSFWKCIAHFGWKMISLAAFYKLIGDLLAFVGPMCISGIIHYVERDHTGSLPDSNVTKESTNVTTTQLEHFITLKEFFTNGYVLAFVMLIAIFLKDTFLQAHHFLVYRIAIRLRSGLQSMVFDKALHLASWELTNGHMTVGKLMNHISTDAQNLMFFCYFLNYFWALPLQLSINIVLLYMQLGYSALIATLVFLVLIPLQYKLGVVQSGLQKKILECADERLKHCSELLQGIKLLKLYAWERMFACRVQDARQKEMRNLFKHACISAVSSFLMRSAPIFVMLVAFVLYPVLENEPLTAAKAFSSMALFDILTLPLFIFPLLVTFTVNAKVSVARLLPYFLAAEVHRHSTVSKSGTNDTNNWNNTIPQIKVEFDSSSNQVIASTHMQDRSREPTPEPNAKDVPMVDYAGMSRETTPEPPRKSYLDDGGRHTIDSSELERLRSDSSPETKHRHRNLSISTINEMDDSDLTAVSRHRPPRSRKTSESDDYVAEKNLRHNRNRSSGQLSLASSDILEDIERYGPLHGIGVTVEVDDGNFTWDYDSVEPYLKNIDFEADAGKLTMVVGAVGSGKSSLLSALFGEMVTLSGNVTLRKGVKVAYAAQNPWLLNASLKENVLFGEPFDKKRYSRVIRACALQPDIDILPAGDLTEIGEKGINLSGGQKQRISVARAMYSRSDLVVLDDPLSALDSHVGAHIFEEGIKKFLLRRRRTVILVTHQLQYLHSAHQIYVMNEGCITHSGNLSDIKANHPDLFETWRTSIQRIRRESEASGLDESSIRKERETLQLKLSKHVVQKNPVTPLTSPTTSPLISRNNSTIECVYERQMSEISITNFDSCEEMTALEKTRSNLSIPEQVAEDDITDPAKKEEKGKLITEEDRVRGSVACSVYMAYMKACSLCLAVFVILLYMLTTVAQVVRDFWLAAWSNSVKNVTETDMAVSVSGGNASYSHVSEQDYLHVTNQGVGSFGYYVRGYALLGGSASFLAFFGAFTLRFCALKASAVLHKNMLTNIIHLPMRFFDTTPLGRVINRFSADINTIDARLPFSVSHLIQNSMICVAAVAVNAISVPYFLIVALPIMIFYFFLQKFFRATSRELQRLDSITKSPVFAHFSETLGGLATIRAYRQQKRFMQNMLAKIDTNITAFLYLNTVNRWLGIRLDNIGALIVFVSALSSMSAALAGHIQSGSVGLCIAYALMVSTTLNWVVRMLTDTESQMSSVERVIHYSQLPAEPETQTQEGGAASPTEEWPHKGNISFVKVNLRYDTSLDPVVRNVTLNIEAGQKVGICGRTGSGKSSLVLSLFRMIDICEGQVLIDDLDIARVPLPTLRSRLSIIPQDPVLFAGTVRYNLDPGNTKTDEELWTALEIAQLKPTIEGLSEQLEYVVSEGGENFSVGQRQLFCLARAFLRRVRILVMDEATASIDMATDAIIQQVIGCAFKSRTVLTIAHRVATIMDYDRVVVLDKGQVVEHDAPSALLSQPESVFSSLVKAGK